jgi:caffeoyl-CoA O-methyltransferase
MSTRTTPLTDRLYNYLLANSLREPPLLAELRAVTATHRWAAMQIAPEQGQFMRLLIELTGARRAIEVGTFTGYSALSTALALPDDGRLVCCDISRDYTDIGRPFWERAGVAHKIDLRIAPASDTLDALLADGEAGSYDFLFIDADKTGYDAYYERGLELLRAGGLVAVDNVLWSGSVADPEKHDADTDALRAFNAKLKDDERVSLSLVPIGDGLTLARKR